MSIPQKPNGTLNPVALHQKLSIFGNQYKNLPFQNFRGIRNITPKFKSGNYCFAISIFQLIFHCSDVVEYLQNNTSVNKTDQLLSNIIKRIYSKRATSTTNIIDFISKWNKWSSKNGYLSNQQEDTKEFLQYLLHSCSAELDIFFRIGIKYKQDTGFIPGTPYYLTFFFRLELNGKNIQELINNFIRDEVDDILSLPEYLFLYINRTDGFNIRENKIDINSFITVKNSNYKFCGTSIFHGNLDGGHYVALFKFFEKFILFDDKDVSCLFYYPNCPVGNYNDIQLYDSLLNKRCIFLLYSKYDQILTFQEQNSYEKVLSTNDEYAFQSKIHSQTYQSQVNQSQINQSVNYTSLISNTLSFISAQSKNKKTRKRRIKSKKRKRSLNKIKTNNHSSECNNSDENDNYFVNNQSPSKAASGSDVEELNHSITHDDDHSSECNNSDENDNYFVNNQSPSKEASGSDVEELNHSITHDDDHSSEYDDFILYQFFDNHESSNSSKLPDESDSLNKSDESDSLTKSNESDSLTKSDDSDLSSISNESDLSSISNESDPPVITNDSNNSKQPQQTAKQFIHLLLSKQEIEVDNMHKTNLSGKLYFNNENIEENNTKRVKPSKFAKFRKLFRYAGKFFRKLNYSDPGRTNAEILQNKLNVNQKQCQQIRKQGLIAYNILKEFLHKKEFKYSELEKSLQPIYTWYMKNYGYKQTRTEIIMNDNLSESLLSYKPFPIYDLFTTSTELEIALAEIENDSKDSDLDDEYIWTSTDDDEKEESNEEEEEEEEYIEDLLPKCWNGEEYTKSHTSGAILALFNDILQYNKWVDENGGCETFLKDDNQTTAQYYYWQERAELLNPDEILIEIRNNVSQQQKPIKGFSFTLSDLKKKIEKDFLKLYNQVSDNCYALSFIDQYLYINNNPQTMFENVKIYKTLKKLKPQEPIFTRKTLQNKISKFSQLSEANKRKVLEETEIKKSGFRIENQKVTDETLKCLITLVLDFPTLSAESYAAYLNSAFGTNEINPISSRTVSRYLKALNFTVNKAVFSPPNKNSIGLRIYRVAWSKLIEKIIKNDNVLLGFLDEAAVTVCEGNKFGRSYIGITPLVNCSLSKVKCSVIALVLPAFGVLYKFIDGAVDNIKYGEFLTESVRFIRRYLCNNETELVFIEDNCPIHNTINVENIINDLKIALLPIVQYSPSLNEVVEGYFGFIKAHNVRLSNETSQKVVKDEIKNNWKDTSNNLFNLQIAQSLYYEWRVRMKMCQRGEPIYSGHINPDIQIEVDYNHLQYVTVNRIVQENI